LPFAQADQINNHKLIEKKKGRTKPRRHLIMPHAMKNHSLFPFTKASPEKARTQTPANSEQRTGDEEHAKQKEK
jgi:hypothetical protein